MAKLVRIVSKQSADALCETQVHAKGRYKSKQEQRFEGFQTAVAPASRSGPNSIRRCQRLGKDCIPSTTVRTKGAKRNTASKNAVLEEKLNDIVSLLRHQNSAQCRRATEAVPTPGSSELSPNSDLQDDFKDQDLTEEELLTFRERHLPYFPLMNIPSDYTAAELQKEKPTIGLAIKALTTKVASKQAVLGKNLREILTQKILIDGERSLPLLVSLLTSIAW